MKTEQAAPLADVACCQHVTDYHPPAAAGGAGALQPGDVLDDRFVITEVISRSGLALIFKAQDLHNGNADVAVKLPQREREGDAEFLARFQREEEIGLGLNHRFVVKFIAVAAAKSRPYLVTEYLHGCTLAHLMEAMSPLTERDALKIGSLLCQALQYLHENGIIHRDLKPHNVMIGCDGTLQLLDFGLATAGGAGRGASGKVALAMGTPDYMAPELVQGKPGDARTDIYSLGAMLYEMLSGRAPFEGDNPLCAMNARLLGDPVPLRELNPAISPQVEAIVQHAMERHPARRHVAAAALRAELDNPAAVTPGGSGGSDVESGPGRAKAGQVLLAAMALLLPVAAALWFWLRIGVH